MTSKSSGGNASDPTAPGIYFTTDREESLLRGYIPLDEPFFQGIKKDEKQVNSIDFDGNGYVTDALLHLIHKYYSSQTGNGLADVTTVDLTGCNCITDYGLKCLVQCLGKATKLKEVTLDGCSQLTDNSCAMLKDLSDSLPNIRCSLRGTNLAFLSNCCHKFKTHSCPAVGAPGSKGSDILKGHVLVWPHPDLKKSFGEFLYSGSITEKSMGWHKAGLQTADDWSLAVTELASPSLLASNFTSCSLSQVIVPFDAASEPKDIKQHIMTAISQVVAKEPVWSKYPEMVFKAPKASSNVRGAIMETHIQTYMRMEEGPNGETLLSNIFCDPNKFGVWISRARLTRSNPYFEMVMHGKTHGGKAAILIGCLFDMLYSNRNPMDSSSQVGGYVDAVELSKDGADAVIGFGIEGGWISEYVPDTDSDFYFVENGEKRKGKMEDTQDLKPCASMYPLVSILTEDKDGTTANGVLPPLVTPPQEVLDSWKSEDRWIERGWSLNTQIDNYGRISYLDGYKNPKKIGYFIGNSEFLLPKCSEFSVEILEEMISSDADNNLVFQLGVVKEDTQNSTLCVMDIVWKTTDGLADFSLYVETGTLKGNVMTKSDAKTSRHTVKIGDVFSVKCTNIENKVVDLEFYHNDEQVAKDTVTFTAKTKALGRLLPYVGIKEKVKYCVKLKNYRPDYTKPAIYPNKITLGRAHFMNVMDDGTLYFKENTHKDAKESTKLYGTFMAKSPFNRELLKYKLTVLEMDNNEHVGIGVSEPNFTIGDEFFVGWRPGTIGYHADNGLYYDNSSQGSKECLKLPSNDSKDAKYNVNDTITVEIKPKDDQTPLRFDAAGNLDSYQQVTVAFFKNDALVYEIPHWIRGAGLYPTITIKNGSVILENFYAESDEVWERFLEENRSKEEQEQLPASKAAPVKAAPEPELGDFAGTEFLMVSVGTGTSDPSGKLEIVRQQMDFSDWPEMTKVSNAIGEMEKDLSLLDFEGQRRYGDLCGVQDKMKSFTQNYKSRLRYTTVNMGGDNPAIPLQERDGLLKDLLKVEKKLQSFQKPRYKIIDAMVQPVSLIMKQLEVEKIMLFSRILEDIKGLEGLEGNTILALLEFMQTKGQLMLLDLGSDKLIIDICYLLTLEKHISLLSATEIMNLDTVVTPIGQSSHVWDRDTLDTMISNEMSHVEKRNLVKSLLRSHMGLIRLPCLRTKYTEKRHIFTVQQNITNPPVPITNYWSSTADNTDFVVMKQTYTLPFSHVDHVLPILIANTSKYGRTILLTGEGIVYHNGAVQTVIVKKQEAGDEGAIVVESKCYCPDIENTKMSKETTSYVKDYTFNVFSLILDVIDDILHRLNIVSVIQASYPSGMVKTSVGCKHNWTKKSDSFTSQSVCTMCEECCCNGDECQYNGIMEEELRHSDCATTTVGCHGCGICISCADDFWTIRSRLRPHGTMVTRIHQTIPEKLRKVTEEEEQKRRQQTLRNPVVQPVLPLDPYVYNEVEFENFCSEAKYLCLKEESDGTITKAYPGQAAVLKDLSQVPLASKQSQPKYNLKPGDKIKLKLSDPLECSTIEDERLEEKGPKLQIEPVYFTACGREVKVIHESGLVLYDTESSVLPVGQLISCRPMTRTGDNFSIKVISTGEKASISMGLAPANYAPNRQCGWNSQSIGFHADDGGVYLESGWPTRKTKTCKVGDIMSLYIDFDRNKGFFRKNGEKMIELNLNPNKLSYYPMIGMHSSGEAVQILEKPLWQPRNDSDKASTPPALPTYKYGNLWISPGDSITMSKVKEVNAPTDILYRGWLVLHNPLKDPVGYKVIFGETMYFGCIEHKQDWVCDLKGTSDASEVKEITVEWTSLEAGREYSETDMEIVFGKTKEKFNQNSHEHILPVIIKDSTASTSMDNLTIKTKDNAANKKNSMCLQVYKNLLLLEEYWVKTGKYHVTVEASSNVGKFLLKYPKCPSFTYPRSFHKGMKVVICMEKGKTYAECIVVDVYSGGRSLALEYSPKDKNCNMTICMMTSSSGFNFPETDFNENEITMLNYEARTTATNLVQTFVQAPPYLLSEGSRKIQNFLQPEWIANVLQSVAQCSQQFTRLTVQEKHITNAARRILEWINVADSKYHFAFLPQQLSEASLTFPRPEEMYKDIDVHRLCFSQAELLSILHLQETYSVENSRINCRLPMHFVDIPGITPSEPLGVDTLFADGLNVWTYVALIAYKLLLPSYKNLVTQENGGRFSREQIEHLMFAMCRTYASLCGIYSATWGGVQFTPINEDKVIKYAVQHDYDHVLHPETVTPIKDTHKLIKQEGHLLCKAHYINVNNELLHFKDKVEFSYEYFEPYTDLITTYQWSHSGLEELPSDFFQRFPQLVYFKLGSPFKAMSKFKSLPIGIAETQKLKAIEIENTAMTELPEDFFMSKSVLWITCKNMPIRKLPSKWPAENESPLLVLVLAGLLLDSLPDEMSQLSELRELELCYNQLTDLPDSFAELKKLTMLKLIGSPWLKLEGTRSQITREQYNTMWTQQYPSVRFYIGEQRIDELFDIYDYNHNGILDEEEIAALSLELFFKVPRVGIMDINDEVTGGIPSVIFKLRGLNVLHLNNNAITMVPPSINNLQNLTEFSLSHNPLLESLPGSLGHLPNIKAIDIQSCPMLRTPPTEIVGRGFDSVKAYLKRLAGGFTECRRTKLMVVGLGGAGKTSLLRALMSTEKKTQGTEKEIPTDGIDIVPWSVKSKDGREVTFSTWDFAGQAVYYNTHQFFLSKRAVYLLLWSMRQGYEHAGLDFWLSSICCHAPGTPIIVVGTQCDLIPKAEIPEKELMERYPQIASFHRVSSIKGIGIEDLQTSLLDITLQQGYMGEKIPQVWLNFEKRILAERITRKSYIRWEVAKDYAMQQGIFDEKDVRMAVQLLHDLGTLQYFDNDFLRDYVVINPQWIVNVMACVVSAQDSPIQKNQGRFLHSDIKVVWKDYDEDLHDWLLRLTEDFDLTFPLPKEPVNIVPCLLPGEPPDDLEWPKIREQKGVRETKMVYRFTYLPSGLFNRAQVRLFQFSDGKKVWKKGSLLSKNKHLALIRQSDNKELVVFVQGPRPENILFLIHEVFESIIEESFNGVSYELFLPCPDCVTKEGTTDPDLLCAKLIQRARDMKAPFIQCYKYFHWISMAQLQEKMPSDSREVADFDFQLQQSIVALEELNNQLIVDVAIIYSKADIPADTDIEALPPALIRDDILKWDISCWFAEDMDSVSYVDMTTAIKNCKILVAMVSDNFERDDKCRDIFLHAKETMDKDIIVVVLGNSLEWQNKDLGMKIGVQERKLMAKNRHRYEVEGGRRDELKEWLTEKIQFLKNQEPILPEVFLSYCWSNSRLAAEKSLRINEHALGWGDPRVVKTMLQTEGLNCWIDTEYVGKEKKGIFADMAAGIRNSKVMLAFISDEYTDSDNCMMELRFGILNMQLPVVAVIVGTGSHWKETEVAMLLRRSKAPEVYLQKENEAGIPVIAKYLMDELKKVRLMGGGAVKPIMMDKKAKKQTKEDETDGRKEKGKDNSSVAYQEEFELIQRKFMRHIIGSDTTPLPRLVLIDFVHSVHNQQKDGDGRESQEGQNRRTSKPSKKMLRPKTATKSRDRLLVADDILDDDDNEDWSKVSFCIKVLCEHEEGWHICPEMYPLAFRNREQLENFLKKAAPYLFRIYTILKQSPLKLKCFAGAKGESYLKWIRAESEDNLDFTGAMMHLRLELGKDEATQFASCLARCRLPSGKVVWLCKEHQAYQHVAKLSTGSTSGSYTLKKVLHTEDKLLMTNMLESKQYKSLKNIKSDKVAPNMPAPIPFTPFIPQVSEMENDIKKEEQKKADDKDTTQTKTNDPKPVPQPGTKAELTEDGDKGEGKQSDETPRKDADGEKDKSKEATVQSTQKTNDSTMSKTIDIPKDSDTAKLKSKPNDNGDNKVLTDTDKVSNNREDSSQNKDELNANMQDAIGGNKHRNSQTARNASDNRKEQDFEAKLTAIDSGNAKAKPPRKAVNDTHGGIMSNDGFHNIRDAMLQEIDENSEDDERGDTKEGRDISKSGAKGTKQVGKASGKSSGTQRKTASKQTEDDLPTHVKKDQIKRMIVESDSKALNKAIKSQNDRLKPNRNKKFAPQPTDLTQQRTNTVGQLVRGSTIKRIGTSSAFSSADLPLEAMAPTIANSAALQGTLTIKTMSNKSTTESIANGGGTSATLSKLSSQQSTPTNDIDKPSSSKSRTKKPSDFPLDKVRPKRIQVRPSGATSNGTSDKDDKTNAPGNTSQACVLQ